jgi:hypothetical protein
VELNRRRRGPPSAPAQPVRRLDDEGTGGAAGLHDQPAQRRREVAGRLAGTGRGEEHEVVGRRICSRTLGTAGGNDGRGGLRRSSASRGKATVGRDERREGNDCWEGRVFAVPARSLSLSQTALCASSLQMIAGVSLTGHRKAAAALCRKEDGGIASSRRRHFRLGGQV